jgi:Ca2+-transporting ATPase
MIIEGSIIGLSVLGIFLYSLSQFNLIIAETIAFSTLAFAQLIHAFNNRSTRKSIFEIGIFSNKYLVLAALVSFSLQLLAVQTTFGNLIFKTVKLESYHWLLIIGGALIPLLVVETKKQLRFKFLP